MSNLAIIDTNIMSYLYNKNTIIRKYIQYLHGKRLAISFMTIEEVLFGAKMNNWGERRIADLRSYVYSYEIFHSSDRIVECCAMIRAHRKRKTMPFNDAWIYATALALDCPLVTHNPKDFEDIPDLNVVTFHIFTPK